MFWGLGLTPLQEYYICGGGGEGSILKETILVKHIINIFLNTGCELYIQTVYVELDLHLNANTNQAYGSDVWKNAWYIYTPFGIHGHSKCFLHLNVSYANSFWSTDSIQIAFDCLPNVCRTAECCLPRLGNASTLNVRFIFACLVHVPSTFSHKPSFRGTSDYQPTVLLTLWPHVKPRTHLRQFT